MNQTEQLRRAFELSVEAQRQLSNLVETTDAQLTAVRKTNGLLIGACLVLLTVTIAIQGYSFGRLQELNNDQIRMMGALSAQSDRCR